MVKSRYYRCLVWLLLLWINSFCFRQVIRIRVINGKTGQPLPRQEVSVSLLYGIGEKAPAKYDAVLHLETEVNGAAQFTLPESVPAHLSVGARLTSQYWHCGCAAPALVVTQELIEKGIVEGEKLTTPAIPVKAEPGEILFVARPFTLFERLFYPLLKG